jgi:predicted DCC family thiol-disulfide oxidoreductase YuxK
VTERIDAWLRAGDITRTSLAGFRIVYATISLLVLPDFSWVAAYPDSMYNPPPGPMQLFSGFPPELVLRALEAAFAACLVAILIGWQTRVASFLAVVVSMTGFGFTYGLGKIDHDILLVLIPAAMALAGWGDRLSVDALRRRGRPAPPERAEQWPLRLFALLIGLAFLTAALPKVNGGWLAWDSHAVQAMQARHYLSNGAHGLLAGPFFHFNNPVFWELMDIATIALEAGMVLAVLSWRSTRVAFAVAATFHLGVWLLMTIPFVMNVIAYAFVVPWDRLPVPEAVRRQARRPRPGLVRAAPVIAVAGGIAWSLLIETFGNAVPVVYPAILITGGLVGGGYLVVLTVRLVRALRDPGDAAAGRLIYDPDCGFCTRSATWLARRRPERVRIQPGPLAPDLAALGLTDDDVARRAYWHHASGEVSAGSQAIAAALVARGGPSLAAGRLIGSPFVAPAAELVYRRIAHRSRIPGGTAARDVSAPLPVADRSPTDT